MRDLIAVLATALLLRACESRVDTAPAPPPAQPEPIAVAGPRPAEPELAAGRWRRDDREGIPLLLFDGRRERPLAAIRCDRESGRLTLERMTVDPEGGIEVMEVRADNRVRTLPVLWDGATWPIAQASLPIGDRMVDSLARTGGPIELTLGDPPPLVLPADPAIGAMIEECRATILVRN